METQDENVVKASENQELMGKMVKILELIPKMLDITELLVQRINEAGPNPANPKP